MSGKTSKIDLEWERRVLCSDEACIGTIGPDGTCRECSKPYEGQLPEVILNSVEDDSTDEPASLEDTVPADEADENQGDDFQDQTDGATDDDDWQQRTLCRDESCIGVIGPDGLCKECGLPLKQG